MSESSTIDSEKKNKKAQSSTNRTDGSSALNYELNIHPASNAGSNRSKISLTRPPVVHPASRAGSNRSNISLTRPPVVPKIGRTDLGNGGSQISANNRRNSHDNPWIQKFLEDLSLENQDAVQQHQISEIGLITPVIEQLSEEDFKRVTKQLVSHENFGETKPYEVLTEVACQYPDLSALLYANRQPLLPTLKSLLESTRNSFLREIIDELKELKEQFLQIANE